jgi:phospho-N-acetylmuramoyl-pentapeptide-transferase
MLYLLFTHLRETVGAFRVFEYPSFRIPAAALTSLVLMLWLFPAFIEFLRKIQYGVSNVREDTPEQHKKKTGTPSMGGLFILVSMIGAALLWADITNTLVWTMIIVTGAFGGIGFVDDWRKVKKKNSKGLSGRWKLIWQLLTLIAVTGLMYLSHKGHIPGMSPVSFDTRLTLPFVSVERFNPDVGWLYIPFAFLVIIGTSNAVNLTDGLDGLAIGPTIVSSSAWLILSYAAGLVLTFHVEGAWVDFNVAKYLNISHIEGVSELAVVCAAIAGAGIGFLWFNTYPASVFMGDVGSLALGGALGTMAVLTKNEFLSCILHGVFLTEAISVITQVTSFKLFHRRVFRMAPIHHHFELQGIAEPKIIVRFWIVSVILALVSLTTLKLR